MSDPPSRQLRQPLSVSSDRARRARTHESPPEAPRRLVAPFPAGVLGRLAGLPEESAVGAALDVVNQLHGGWGCVVFSVEESLALAANEEAGGGMAASLVPIAELAVPGLLLQERFLHAAPDLLLRCCEAAAQEAILAKEPLVVESILSGQTCLVLAVPLLEGGRPTAVLCRVHDLRQRGEAAALAALQETGLLRLVSSLRSENRRLRTRFGRVAAFVELLGSSEGGIDFAECARRLANHLRETMDCETVALSVRTWQGPKLAAVSGETGPAEAHSPGRRTLLSHLSETASRGQAILHRRNGDGGAGSPLREWFDPALSLCLPLTDAQGRNRGAWLFLWKEEPLDFEERRSLLEAATPEVAPLLSLLHRSKPGTLAGPIVRMWKRGSARRRRILAILGGAILAATLLPFPYPVRATCELQPVVRRVIAAPFDGILQRSVARAGELVEEGQLLAVMDGRELRSQHSEAVAERERAAKESDQALAEGRVADARMAALEAEGLGHRIGLLEYRMRHLEVRSPINGLILEGDLERSEGAPLRVGDPLFEVGPLDRLVAEIAVSARDVSLVRAGAAVTLKLESDSLATTKSEVLRVAPKSEWREDRNVFLCEAEIENPDASLRAGLKGKAKVAGPRRPLLWIWGRDAWLALRYHLW